MLQSTTTNYEQQAIDFADKYGITLKIIDNNCIKGYFDENDPYRYIFKSQLKRNKKEAKKEIVTVAKHMKYFINMFANLKKLYGTHKPKQKTVLV